MNSRQNNKEQLWSDSLCIESVSPKEIKEKERTIYMMYDEEMNR